MTFRGLFPSFLVLLSFAMLTWHQMSVFAQVAYPGNAPGIPQQGASGAYNPHSRQPAPGFPQGGHPGTVPGTGSHAAGVTPAGQYSATGPVASGTSPQNGYMIDRPLGVMPNEPQPGYPQGVQNGREIVPPPDGYNPGQEELNYINRFLTAWNEQSKNIEALDYDFTCWEYRGAEVVSETYGQVKFRAPDKGLVEIDSELMNGKKNSETNKRMKFICTGEAVYHFDFADKKLTEFVIPVEDRGKGVMDSPLMILVGANPRELQERFYLLVLDTPASFPNCIHLQAWPKWLEDAREFKCVNVVIDRQAFQAKALLLYDANGEGRKGYQITNTKVNVFGKIANIILPKDGFDRNTILNLRSRDWAFETKTDYLPEASNQQIAQPNPSVRATPAPVSPQYGSPANTPSAPGTLIHPTAPRHQGQPGTMTQGTLPPGTLPPGQVPPGTVPGQVNYTGTQPPNVAPPNNTPPYGVHPNTPAPQQNHSFTAMPPHGNGSPSVIR